MTSSTLYGQSDGKALLGMPVFLDASSGAVLAAPIALLAKVMEKGAK